MTGANSQHHVNSEAAVMLVDQVQLARNGVEVGLVLENEIPKFEPQTSRSHLDTAYSHWIAPWKRSVRKRAQAGSQVKKADAIVTTSQASFHFPRLI
jgi:hypothetical protein